MSSPVGATEGTSCGQWPPRPSGAFMVTSAQPLETDLPAPRGLQTEILQAPPNLPHDPTYPPLAPQAAEPGRGKSDAKRNSASQSSELLSSRPPGWIPEAIRTALADLGRPLAGTATPTTPTPPTETHLAESAQPMQDESNQPNGTENNPLWDDLRAMLTTQPAKRPPRKSTRRTISIPPLGSSAAASQRPATRSRAAADAALAAMANERSSSDTAVEPTDERVPNGFCDACGTPGSLICCDDCERSFHFTCLNPPWDLDTLPAGLVHDVSWSCNVCQARKAPRSQKRKAPQRLFGPLLGCIAGQNPREFGLPSEVQKYFKGTAADAGGAYVDSSMLMPWKQVMVKTAKVMVPQQRDPYRLRDKSGFVLCYRCNESALPPPHWSSGSMDNTATEPQARPMLSCDFCPLHWHVDCLNPPLACLPPNTRKWRCPAHTEHVHPAPRQPRLASQTQVIDLPVPNAGEVQDAYDQVGSALFPQIPPYTGPGPSPEFLRFKVPEQVIQRDFWNSTNKGFETLQAYARQRASQAQSGRVTLKEQGNSYQLSVAPNLPIPSSSQLSNSDPWAQNLQRIMTPVPYPGVLDQSITFVSNDAPPGQAPNTDSGVVVVPDPRPASKPIDTPKKDAAPARQLPSRRSKTTGEEHRRRLPTKLNKRRRITPVERPAPVLQGEEAEQSLWRSTTMVSSDTLAQLAAVQRLVDYVGEDRARSLLGQ